MQDAGPWLPDFSTSGIILPCFNGSRRSGRTNVMTTVYLSSGGYSQQDNVPCNVDQIISNWFYKQGNKLIVLQWPPQSTDLRPIKHLWEMVEWAIPTMAVQSTNLPKLSDATMLIWIKICKECFQDLVESVNVHIIIHYTVQKENRGPTWYCQKGYQMN